MNKSTVCFVAGKSGGHIIPALTLAQRIKEHNPESSVLFFSTTSPLDMQLLSHHESVDTHIALSLENIPAWYRLPFFAYRFLKAYCRSLYYLLKHKPHRVISMGGYISLPVCMAAKTVRIPVELHELNAIPGKATKALTPLANKIVIPFKHASSFFPAQKCSYMPYPHRFTAANKELTQTDALHHIGFADNKKTILILGGSQGSVFINETIKKWLEQNLTLHSAIQVIHQTGAQDTTNWHAFYAQFNIPALIFAYHNSMQYYYTAADLIICRAGAGTLWEIAFFEKQAITIPLETVTTDHQVDNARAIAAQHPHLFKVIMQREVAAFPDILFKKMETMLMQ
jgi:UDP-N-acetylglucosamine--N-acetylmuramyl-(pentapeptide) pyrophosphoryl-undecaprenol N-acetylglucosamine transferase